MGYGGTISHRDIPVASYWRHYCKAPVIRLLGNAAGERAIVESIRILHSEFPQHVVKPGALTDCLKDLCELLRSADEKERFFQDLVRERGGCKYGAVILYDDMYIRTDSIWLPPRIINTQQAEDATIYYLTELVLSCAICYCVGYLVLDLTKPFPELSIQQYIQIYSNSEKVKNAISKATEG